MEKKFRQNDFRTIVKFENGIEIKANHLNWMLYIPAPRTNWYYSTLDTLFEDLLIIRVKGFSGISYQKTLDNLLKAVGEATREIKKMIASSCLEEQKRRVFSKDD